MHETPLPPHQSMMNQEEPNDTNRKLFKMPKKKL